MEEKKINELSDEALDAVTGGAEIKYDQSTNTYYVLQRIMKCITPRKTGMRLYRP